MGCTSCKDKKSLVDIKKQIEKLKRQISTLEAQTERLKSLEKDFNPITKETILKD